MSVILKRYAPFAAPLPAPAISLKTDNLEDGCYYSTSILQIIVLTRHPLPLYIGQGMTKIKY